MHTKTHLQEMWLSIERICCLEGDLVAYGQHDYAVLGTSGIIFVNMCQAKIVASINHEIRDLV